MLSGAQKLEDRLKNFRQNNQSSQPFNQAQKKKDHNREAILNDIKNSQAKK
jgi:hypothetical protein